MKLEIKTRENITAGKATFDQNGARFDDSGNDPAISSQINKALVDGVEILGELEYKEKKQRIMFTKLVPPADPLFDLAFKKWLELSGYQARELDSESEQKILKLLERFPDNQTKKRLLERLPQMDRLELDLILGELEDFLLKE